MTSMMLVQALSWAAFAASSDVSTACSYAPRPFAARYEVIEDGKLRGAAETRLEWRDGAWHYRLETEARKGWFKARATQTSRFSFSDGPVVAGFANDLQAGPFSRRSSGTVRGGIAQGEHRGDEWRLTGVAGAVDRLTLNVRLAQGVACAVPLETVAVLDKGRLRQFEYQVGPLQALMTGVGEIEAIPVIRVSGKRTTTTWLAPELNFIPVRMEQDKDDDERDLQLIEVDWLDD